MRRINRVLVVLVMLFSVFGASADVTEAPAQASAVGLTYDRNAAVKWALESARYRQPDWDGCAWFVSNALWKGGIPKTWEWNDWPMRPTLPGTKTATVARDLTNYLRWTYHPRWRRMYFWKNAASLARPGDLIGYDWSGDGHIDHLAIIVRIAPGQYPEISEWGVEHPRSSYQKRGWSYSIKHGTWIPHVPQYARVMAWLLHFEVP